MMDAGAETLNGTMWFANTSSPSYEQLSPVRPGRCDVVTTPQQVGVSKDRSDDLLSSEFTFFFFGSRLASVFPFEIFILDQLKPSRVR